MEVVICIKPVKSNIIMNDSYQRDNLVINPYDLYALKDTLKHKVDVGARITCISMAGENAQDVLIRCIAMGADEAVLLCDPAFGGADTVATTYTIATAIEKLSESSLIVCGGQSIDGETGQIPFGIAQRLSIPCIANVRSIINLSEDEVVLESATDEIITIIRVRLPIVIAYQDFISTNDTVSLMSIKKAKRKGVMHVDSEQLGADKNRCGIKGSKTKVMSICEGKQELRNKGVTFINGTSSDKARFIHVLLKKNLGEH